MKKTHLLVAPRCRGFRRSRAGLSLALAGRAATRGHAAHSPRAGASRAAVGYRAHHCSIIDSHGDDGEYLPAV